MEELEDTYKTINKPSKGFFKDKGSKFFAYAYPVENEEKAKELLDKLQKDFYDARHHCYAYVIGFDKETTRQNDDGEPSGTAGKPIYGQIMSYELTNILIVVIRYFGGIKLGVRGLINAYKFASADALENAKIVTRQLKDVYQVHYGYPMMNKVMHLIKQENLDQLETKFEIDCRLTFAVRKKDSIRIYKIFKDMYPLKINYLHSK